MLCSALQLQLWNWRVAVQLSCTRAKTLLGLPTASEVHAAPPLPPEPHSACRGGGDPFAGGGGGGGHPARGGAHASPYPSTPPRARSRRRRIAAAMRRVPPACLPAHRSMGWVATLGVRRAGSRRSRYSGLPPARPPARPRCLPPASQSVGQVGCARAVVVSSACAIKPVGDQQPLTAAVDSAVPPTIGAPPVSTRCCDRAPPPMLTAAAVLHRLCEQLRPCSTPYANRCDRAPPPMVTAATVLHPRW
jgi:hypothetical protein